MSKPSIGNLQEQIERLVREHIVATRRAAAAAVERAFSAQHAARAREPQGADRRRATGPRRASAEVATLGERMYEAVCANPGAAMTLLASRLGSSPRELHRPATLLRRAGRVRTVGERQSMRYLPMAGKRGVDARSA